MKAELRNNQDFLAGLMFCVIGLVAVGIAGKNYPVGTSLNMGPAISPRQWAASSRCSGCTP